MHILVLMTGTALLRRLSKRRVVVVTIGTFELRVETDQRKVCKCMIERGRRKLHCLGVTTFMLLVARKAIARSGIRMKSVVTVSGRAIALNVDVAAAAKRILSFGRI